MTNEIKVLINSMIINLFVSIMKVITGINCKCKSMIADGLHSLSDFITDIIALFGFKYSKKRANKTHPDGYGRFEYIIDMFIATIILILGIYTTIHSFSKEPTKTNIIWIIVVIFSIILKLINSNLLKKKAEEYHSPILITSSIESKDDVYSSIGVIIIVIISQFSNTFPILKYADTIGSFIIGLLIIKTSYNLMKENINSLLGTTEENKEINKKIKEIVNNYKDIKYKNMQLERHGSYYVLELEVYVLKNIKVYKLLSIESELRKKIKKLNLRIKFIDVNLFHKTE